MGNNIQFRRFATMAKYKEKESVIPKEDVVLIKETGSIYNDGICYGSQGGKPDLRLEARVVNGQVQVRIFEIVQHGYICFFRKKRHSSYRNGMAHRYYGYIPYGLKFPLQPNSLDGPYILDVSTLTPGVWTPMHLENVSMISTSVQHIYDKNGIDKGKQPGYKFSGATHAGLCSNMRNNSSRDLKTLKAGLKYVVMNPNYLSGVKENGRIPEKFIAVGQLVQLKFFLRVNKRNSYRLHVQIE